MCGPVMRLKSTYSWGLFLLGFLLSGCGKPLNRPELLGPTPKENSLQNLILGKKLSAADLKTLLRGLNEKGEFDNLIHWADSLSSSEWDQWGQFINSWVYEDALSSKGLISQLKNRVQEKSFSRFNQALAQFLEKNPKSVVSLKALFADENFIPAIKRLIYFLDPQVSSLILEPYLNAKDSYLWVKENPVPDSNLAKNEIFDLFHDKNAAQKLKTIADNLISSEAFSAFALAGRELQRAKGENGFSELSQSISKSAAHLGNALRFAQLLNRPGEKIVAALREGLKNNPDAIQALSLKWDPLLVRTLSGTLRKVLLEPEDGQKLDKVFWMSLVRSRPEDAPTTQFIRLYSIIYSGIQKLGDPRRLEPDQDSGSYRLSFQLNALFLTKMLEEFVKEESSTLQSLPDNEFEKQLWLLPVKPKEYQLSLADQSSPKKLNPLVKKDLEALELQSLITRIENLLLLEDSGKNTYHVSVNTEGYTLQELFSEAVNEAHRARPFTDINPLLVTLVQDLGTKNSPGGFSLAFIEESPNLLNQGQQFLASLSDTQWKTLKNLLFEELKIGQLEPEDRMLILGLFQSDPEVAEWVNEVLLNIESIYLLDKSEGVSVFEFYRLVLKHLTQSNVNLFSIALSDCSEMGLFQVSEEGKGSFPGILSIIKSANELTQMIRGLSGLNSIQVKFFQKTLLEVFGENQNGEKGLEVLYRWLQPHDEFVKAVFEEDWSKSISKEDFLHEAERKWLLDFVREGGLEQLKSLPPLMTELKTLSEKKVIAQGMSLLSRMQNERIKEISQVFYHWDVSGELKSFFELSDKVLNKGEKP